MNLECSVSVVCFFSLCAWCLFNFHTAQVELIEVAIMIPWKRTIWLWQQIGKKKLHFCWLIADTFKMCWKEKKKETEATTKKMERKKWLLMVRDSMSDYGSNWAVCVCLCFFFKWILIPLMRRSEENTKRIAFVADVGCKRISNRMFNKSFSEVDKLRRFSRFATHVPLIIPSQCFRFALCHGEIDSPNWFSIWLLT